MPTTDKRVDAYIEKSADFAKPILTYIRAVVHEACPEVQEEMKWSFPNFMYKGMFCSMAAFKEHCAMNFWKGSLIFGKQAREAMGHFGRIGSVKDLPPKKELLKFLKEAKRLNDQGIGVPKPKKTAEKKELVIPEYVMSALKKDKRVLAVWEGFSHSHRKEYVEWITEAKTEATREKRLGQMMEWLAEGKSRNWKYERR